jgi:hypothetical protein
MIESPMLQRMIAEKLHKVIFALLKARFGTVPRDVTRHIRAILDEDELYQVVVLTAKCPDLHAFREALLA